MTFRTRFAPSPTGYLHVGGARTALFNWLLTRANAGTFVLRVEDTDRERSSDEHTKAILSGMEWLGLDIDEGPYFQSEGVERHTRQAHALLSEGKAYRDFSDPDELRAAAAEQGIGHPSILARRWADELGTEASEARAAAGDPFAIRLRVPEGEVGWEDMVHGAMAFGNEDIDDFVLLRGDGSPVYNLAVVSDDIEHRITHVIRGDDHISNTPKQILIYRALGAEVPTFGHLPMILGSDGKRLSKRHGATAVGDYAKEGIVPDAMVNFLALLGWNPGDDTEVMDRAELVRRFSMERVQKKSAVFDTDKLGWFNGQYLAAMPASELAPLVLERLAARGVTAPDTASMGEGGFHDLLRLLKIRVRSVDDVADQALPFLIELDGYEEEADAKHFRKDPDAALERLGALAAVFAEAPDWEEEPLEEILRETATELEVGAGKMIHPLRLAVTGRGFSPGIFEVLVLLGRDKTLARVAAACKHLSSTS